MFCLESVRETSGNSITVRSRISILRDSMEVGTEGDTRGTCYPLSTNLCEYPFFILLLGPE